ncbi:SET domain-containing protein [Eremomyces bilateralis CBS 781.70]|uniref:SET domain-containing protein n=1 Tax=Eremomyces bilateralis CBS 781.70 TaxID=1392243 RepID=A0A6G1G525_9PEZI|nr:SET domain-containing protein [Eremomyces bilateralis CBS 781.70]KAF1813010.1 SET domain-containing protein [Eremomyces bilateralis CBS 781.70]
MRVWSHRPKCMRKSEDHDFYCIFTSTAFANGRGISIFTDPATAKSIAGLPAFTNPETVAHINDESGSPFEKRALPGRGFGLVATRPFHRGDSVFSHTPVYMVNDQTYEALNEEDRLEMQQEAVRRLPPGTRDLYLELHGHFGGDAIDDRLNTNSFYVELDSDRDEKHNIMLPETSRINHDCRPNSHYWFDPDTLTHHVHALRDIQIGEELSISYIDPTLTRSTRQAVLKNGWGFDCSCSACTQREIFTAASDHRLDAIDFLTKELANRTEASTASPETAELLVSLCEQERLDGPIADAYTYAAIEYNGVGDHRTAQKYAMLAIERGLLYSGEKDSDVIAMYRLMADPQNHWSWMYRRSRHDP